jgi:hypothetical protein
MEKRGRRESLGSCFPFTILHFISPPFVLHVPIFLSLLSYMCIYNLATFLPYIYIYIYTYIRVGIISPVVGVNG